MDRFPGCARPQSALNGTEGRAAHSDATRRRDNQLLLLTAGSRRRKMSIAVAAKPASSKVGGSGIIATVNGAIPMSSRLLAVGSTTLTVVMLYNRDLPVFTPAAFAAS